MDFKFSQKSSDLQEKMNKFFQDHIFPNEEAYEKAILDSGDPLHIPELLDELKDKARKEDLWNLFLPDSEHGAGLTNIIFCKSSTKIIEIGNPNFDCYVFRNISKIQNLNYSFIKAKSAISEFGDMTINIQDLKI